MERHVLIGAPSVHTRLVESELAEACISAKKRKRDYEDNLIAEVTEYARHHGPSAAAAKYKQVGK
jgi:hypothetical protein